MCRVDKKHDNIELEGISNNDIARRVKTSLEKGNVDVKLITPKPSLKRSDKVIKPLQQYSLSLHYLLLSDVEEL